MGMENRMIAFDQYQRYQTLSAISKKISKKFSLESLKILEVGANAQKNLGKFIDADIYYTDIEMIEGFENDDHFFVADATNLRDMTDSSYDVVIASDVFEHIPEELRENFLKELYRVAKYAAILCFPFDAAHVRKAERRANEYFKALAGRDYEWLIEHIQNGLPKREMVDNILDDAGILFSVIEHGSIEMWEKIIKAHFYACRYTDLITYREMIDEYYDEFLYSFDVSEKNYRVFYALCKNEKIKECCDEIFGELFSDGTISRKDIEKIDVMCQEVYQIASLRNLLCASQGLELQRYQVEQLNTRLSEAEQLKESYYIEMKNLHNALEDYKKECQRLQQELASVAVAYDQIRHSTSWKITKPFRFMAEALKRIGRILMPLRVRKGLYIILHEGFGTFLHRYSAFRRKKKAEQLFMKKIMEPKTEVLVQQSHTKFEQDILFSIVVPLYNTPKQYLEEMIASCRSQTYGGWELCLADGSDAEHSYVGETVRKMMQKDSRIKYKVLEKNAGISENTNAALDMALGDYIALLDHDDLLHPSALYEYMKVICEQDADFIYCDEMTFERKLDNIVTMHFKPDFAIDNLRANNYICHFSVFSKELLEKVGKFRKEFDGSQDHDMILRLTEQAEKIVHVPRILYYWRSHPASVASDISSKTYAIDAGKRAVLSHLERCGLRGSVESSKAFPTIFNVRYEIEGKPLISILIPNKDNTDMLSRCIDSVLKKSTYDNYEILIIENNSTQDLVFKYYDMIQKNPKVRVLKYQEKGFNYAAINNFAVKEAQGEYLLFLNNDIEIITPEWLEEMLMFAMRKDVGAVGAKLYYPDNTIQHAGVIIGLGRERCAGHSHFGVPRDNFGYMGRLSYAQNFSAVTAACMMISKEIFESVGGFDEKFAVAYNDVDLCLTVKKAGYKNIWTPLAEAYHYESVSRGYDTEPDKQERFQREVSRFKEKWQMEIDAGDPYYNVNLTLDLSDFSPRIQEE